MKARIYRPTRTAMQQSGQASNNHWVLELAPQSSPFIDPLMGWTGMTDTTRELRMVFTTQEEAIDYAKRHKIDFELQDAKIRVIKPKSYAANFAFNRVIDSTTTSQ
jgi:hypothetical protein